MSNAAGALDGLKALEDEAIAAHKRVAEALEGCRLLLYGAIVERYRLTYQITALREDRGIVHASGVRFYPKKNKAGYRDYDLGDLRDCKILKYPNEGDTPAEQIIPRRLRASLRYTTTASK